MADLILERQEAASRRKSGGAVGRRPRNTNRLLLFLVILLALVLAGELIFHFVLVPYFRISRIVVESDTRVPEEVITRLAGITPGLSLLEVDASATEARVSAHPSIREVTVSRSFPDTLILRVETRKPVAIVFSDIGGVQTPVLVDSEGILFERGSLTEEKAADLRLPVLSGLQLERFESGMELPIRLVGLVGRLREMQIEAPQLFRQISEFRVVPRGSHDFEVILYPMSYPVALRMAGDFTVEQCTYALVVLDALRQDGRLDDLAEIDARGQEMVLRLREDARG